MNGCLHIFSYEIMANHRIQCVIKNSTILLFCLIDPMLLWWNVSKHSCWYSYCKFSNYVSCMSLTERSWWITQFIWGFEPSLAWNKLSFPHHKNSNYCVLNARFNILFGIIWRNNKNYTVTFCNRLTCVQQSTTLR